MTTALRAARAEAGDVSSVAGALVGRAAAAPGPDADAALATLARACRDAEFAVAAAGAGAARVLWDAALRAAAGPAAAVALGGLRGMVECGRCGGRAAAIERWSGVIGLPSD